MNNSQAVIPAKAGIQCLPLISIKNNQINDLDPGFRRGECAREDAQTAR